MQLKALRESRKLTQKDVARFLDIPFKTYQNYEREVREADSDILCKLADLYGVSLDTLFGRQAETTTQEEQDESIKALEEMFYKLNDAGRNELFEYAEYLLSKDKFQKKELQDYKKARTYRNDQRKDRSRA